MTISTNTDNVSSFADIVSNLLGVLIVVLLLISLFATSSGHNWPETTEEALVSLPFKKTKTLPFPPWEDIFVLAEDVMVPIRPSEIIPLIQKADLDKPIKKPDGEFWLSDRAEPRDVDVFMFTYKFDWKAFRKVHKWPHYGPMVDFIEVRLPLIEKYGRMLSFFLYPTGVDLFSKIYPELLKHDIRFRVIRLNPNEPIRIYRDWYQYNTNDVFLH